MKNKIIIGLVILLVIFIVVAIAFFPTKKEEKRLTKKETVEQISNGYINGISKNELSQLTNQEINDKTILAGKDAYLLKKPSKKLIEKYNLNEYVEANEKYFNDLYQIIKNNYEWKFTGQAENNQDTYFISLKTYSYGIYLNDLETLSNLLLQNNQVTSNEQQQVNQYKAKVIAMKLLSNHLQEYITNEEEKTIAITFSNINNNETKNSLMQYLVDLAGYNNHGDNINTMIQNRETRLQNYINQAINDGTLNKSNMLEL